MVLFHVSSCCTVFDACRLQQIVVDGYNLYYYIFFSMAFFPTTCKKKCTSCTEANDLLPGRATIGAHALLFVIAHAVKGAEHPRTLLVMATPPSEIERMLGYAAPPIIVNPTLL